MEGQQRQDVEAGKGNPWARLPRWAKWTLGVFGALTLLVIGAFIGGSEEDDLKAELTEARVELTEAEQARDASKAQAEKVFDRSPEIIGKAESEAATIRKKARSERSELSGELSNLRDEVKATQGELASAESSLAGAEDEAALSSITDGIWKAEADYIPGTYRAPGGNGCYWATLNSADPYDIASNENGTGPQVATIESPYFQTTGCGTWERIE